VKLRQTQRRVAATRKKLPGQLCNKVLGLGMNVTLEKLSCQGLQKNYGRSVAVRAPGLFVTQPDRQSCACWRWSRNNHHLANQTVADLYLAVLSKRNRFSLRVQLCGSGVEAQRDLGISGQTLHR
jgi:hypothetical protein